MSVMFGHTFISAGRYSNFSISTFVRQDITIFDIVTILLERGCAKDTLE